MIYNTEFGDIYNQISGPEGKPVVILCHGIGMDHRTFEGQVRALQENYRVIVWDMPGHGLSSLKRNKIRFSILAADCLAGLLDEAGAESAVLVGLSLGSIVVQQALNKYPERVTATVHIGGIPLYPKYSSLLKPLFRLVGIFNLMPARMFYGSFAKHRTNTQETRRYLEEVISKTGKKLVLDITRDLGDDLTEGIPEPPQRPMLITYGADDIFTRGFSEKWYRRTPGSKRVVIPNANHIANQENEDAFNQALLSFLQEAVYEEKGKEIRA